MHLRYSLYKLSIHKDPNVYKARFVSLRVANAEQVADMMVSLGSTVGKADIVAVFEVLAAALETLLKMGFHIHLPFADFELTIQGRFDGITDEYDPRRHQVYVSITPGTRLRKAIRLDVQLTKDQQGPKTPNPDEYWDLDSGERNHLVTPGGVGRVNGSRLKFDPADPRQGIFFVDKDYHAVRVESVIQNKTRELIFKVPPLPAGTYRLEVRAYIHNSPDVRTGRLFVDLTVP